MSNSGLLEVLNERVMVFDGAMGTQIQGSGLVDADWQLESIPNKSKAVEEAIRHKLGKSLEGCNDLLSLTNPALIQGIHERYLAAGSDMIETNTFGCSSIVLSEYGLESLVYDIAYGSAVIAKQACENFSTSKPRFAIGAVGPGTRLVTLGQTSWTELEQTYTECFRGLIDGGVDGLLLETLQDLLMVKATLVAANNAMKEANKQIPVFVQITIEQTGAMLMGSDIGAALNMIECFPCVKAFGLNCATGPVEMAPHVRFLGQNSTRPISVQPNAGLPVLEKGQASYKLTPSELAQHHVNFVEEHGAAIVGGCCGTTPDHILAVADAVSGLRSGQNSHWVKVKGLFPGFDFEMKTPEQSDAINLIGCSSLYQFQPYRQDSSFLIVGERTNANGSRAFRDLLAKENWEGLTEIARDLETDGAHVLDVCTAFVGRNEIRDMETLLAGFNRHITVPLMIDSTEWQVLERALQCVAGKPMINSINFEDGDQKADKVLSLARRYGAAIVALTIDELGMAKTVEKKLEIADRIVTKTRDYGIADHDVFIDCLTFTLGSGDEEFRKAGMETIEAISRLKEKYPRVNTILGVSNISFGLKASARQILNSVFLRFAQEAGLTSAIVDIAKIRPQNQIPPEIWQIASDLVFDRRRFSAA